MLIPIPLGDPLYNSAPNAFNFMVLNRATLANPASDFDTPITNPLFGQPGQPANLQLLKDGVTPIYDNNTGLSIDQSQTYGSDASVNALLREYDAFGNVTGRLITGAADGNNQDGTTATVAELADLDHNLGTWADMIANAANIGIDLTGYNPTTVAPMLRVDQTGALLFDANPNAAYTLAAVTGPQAADDPFVRDGNGEVLFTNQVILSDVSHSGIPLGRHFVSGDHRANENFGLTAVHNVFHEEHNIQTGNIKQAIIDEYNLVLTLPDPSLTQTAQQAANEFIDKWLAPTATPPNGQIVSLTAAEWNGDAIFQAARIVTESQYNHIAIDQYVGTLQPALPEFVSYSADIDMGISLEFSQAVFRLGHSMLVETIQIAVVDINGALPGDPGYIPTYDNSNTLFDGFLNPDDYALYGPQAITLGLMNQYGNEVDEFVTPALQQALVGLPLDLPALNIARGREVGLPTLNELRDQVFQGLAQDISNTTNGSALAPYTSWGEFGANLRHEGTLVNMIAAYGRDDSGFWGLQAARDGVANGTVTLAALRATAQAILDASADTLDINYQAAQTFIWGEFAPSDNPDIAGPDLLGDIVQTPGDLGFWDVDLWVGGLAERPLFDAPLGTTFSFIMLDFGQRMQDGDRFYYLYRMAPGNHLGDQIIGEQFNEMIMRTTGLENLHGDAFGTPHGTFVLSDTMSDNFNAFDPSNTVTLSDGSTVVAGDGHFVVAGLGGNDRLVLGNGDDTAYGGEGNDYIQGGQGNDKLYGGPGDDFIIDDENDDFIHGGAGNDYINAGPGALDTVHGGTGNDELHGGDGIDEIFGEEGDDALFGEGDTDLMLGGEGNDYFDGGDSVDEMFGGDGNDWMRGGVGDDHMNGGAGNDLMEGGLGPAANDGDRYFGDTPLGQLVQEVFNGSGEQGDMDIASYEDVDLAITADLQTSNLNGTFSNQLDTYALTEGLVGSRFNDNLTGADINATSSNGPDNYLIGGAGSDILTGLGGDDLIFGDSMTVDHNLHWDTRTILDNFYQDFSDELRPDFGDFAPLPDGTPDTTRPWYGHYLGDNYTDGAVDATFSNIGTGLGDIAVFSGDLADYTIMAHATIPNAFTIIDTRGIDSSPTGDFVKDIETLRFADGDFSTLGLADQTGGGGGGGTFVGTPEDDTIEWSVGDPVVVADGAGGTDEYKVTGNNADETYFIETPADYLARTNLTPTDANTEIVVSRGLAGPTGASTVIAELDNFDNIDIDGNGGNDQFVVSGNFAGTDLDPNTIILTGSTGDDNFDITGLTSSHRIVFQSKGGHDTIVGALRDHDVIQLAAGTVIADYVSNDNNDGTTTLSDGTNSLTYKTGTMPNIIDETDPSYGDSHGDGSNDDNDDHSDNGDDDDDHSDNGDDDSSNDDQDAAPSYDDVVTGGDGEDHVFGGQGDDDVSGGDGDDYVFGNEGNDHVSGGDGDDHVYGDGYIPVDYNPHGDDHYETDHGGHHGGGHGGGGSCDTDCDPAPQTYRCGKDDKPEPPKCDKPVDPCDRDGHGNGYDGQYGLQGGDVIEGDLGNDYLYGGQGADLFLYTHGEGYDTIVDFQPGYDEIKFEGDDASFTVNYSNGGMEFDFRQWRRPEGGICR